MSQFKYCQGPLCHTHDTNDRKKGPKDKRRNETRRRSSFNYLGGSACDMRCEREWFRHYGQRALDHFGRITEAKVLTKDNAWRKSYDWRHDGNNEYYVYNHLTTERRPITEEQYINNTATTQDGQLNI